MNETPKTKKELEKRIKEVERERERMLREMKEL